MKLLIAGGGTGGHVFPAIAVAREWLSRDAKREVVIVGTKRGLEMKLVPEAGLPLETIRSAGLKGIGGMKFVRNAALLPASLIDSLAIVRRHGFAAAFGVGGYASGPMMLAAWMGRVPTVIFEPNAEPGFTNRVLARLVTRAATAYEATAERWGKKAIVTGCPVRKEFFGAPLWSVDTQARLETGDTKARPFRVLITGGSQGALPINRAVVDAMDLLAARKDRLRIVHQTGERDYNAVRVAYARREFNAEVVPFIANMAERFAQADLIVCRSGAITVAEVAASGRAAIFIPFAGATDSHQLRNAQALAARGAARLIPQSELTGERLAGEIFSLLDDPSPLSEMAARAREHARPRAVEDIVDLIEGAARR
jgi:UDP-N-acetylglucosamine--N-acetylmuramyl-(pentapeptide) pyrophosphoryl-undecaprenol N-acetylglucosamine transferase